MEDPIPTVTLHQQTFEEFQEEINLRNRYDCANNCGTYSTYVQPDIKDIESYFLMAGPIPPAVVLASYMLFVGIGPLVMKNFDAFKLKSQLQIYNLIQVVFCFYLLMQVFTLEGVRSAKLCRTPGTPPTYHPHLTFVSWLFFMAKTLDLMDTVFIVLRKKNGHLSFLHLSHHTFMFFSTWYFNKYVYDRSFAILQYLNTAVHLIMYTYYFITALGPKYAKYIWWKKYLTTIQLCQFGFGIGYIISLWYKECEIPMVWGAYMVTTLSALIVLFVNFYIKKYIKPNKNH